MPFVNFRQVKEAVTILQVLDRYGVTETLKRSGDSLRGPCPVHKGGNPTAFRVSVSKNCWNCFGACQGGGNILDLVARLQRQAGMSRLRLTVVTHSRITTSERVRRHGGAYVIL